MEKIRISGIVLGGVVAALTFMAVEFFVEGTVLMLSGVNERVVLLELFPDIVLKGSRFHLVNMLYLVLVFIFVVWIYAILRSRFGPGRKTAIMAGLVFWVMILLLSLNHMNMNIFPAKLVLMSLIFNLVELPVAAVVGAGVYEFRINKNIR